MPYVHTSVFPIFSSYWVYKALVMLYNAQYSPNMK